MMNNAPRLPQWLGRLGLMLIAVGGSSVPVQATPAPPPPAVHSPVEQIQYAISPTGERIAIPESLATSNHQIDAAGNQVWFVPGQRPAGQRPQPEHEPSPPRDEPSDEVGTERVIDADERLKINNTATYPNGAVVEIRYKQNGVPRLCTGWIYDDNYVGTAGHCILSREGFWSTDITVYPGRNGTSLPYGSCGSVNMFVSDLWQRDRTANYDYGTIQLNCTVGTQTGTFGLNYTSGSWVNTSTTLQAYHGDKDGHTTQWYTIKSIMRDTGYLLFYQHDMTGGASGGPVFFYQSGCGHCVIAVNAQEYAAPTDNSGPKMNQGMFNFYNALR